VKLAVLMKDVSPKMEIFALLGKVQINQPLLQFLDY